MVSEAEFGKKYDLQYNLLKALADAEGISSSEKSSIRKLRRLKQGGFDKVKKNAKGSWDQYVELLEEFMRIGAIAVLSAGSQRAGDFLNNQMRGRWAEDVVRAGVWEGTVIVEYGPSGAAMPGAEDHAEVVRTFRAITLLEGKRPDLIAFDTAAFKAFSSAQTERVARWPHALLAAEDKIILASSLCGIEVKSSLWHYQTRLKVGGGPLSVTLKEEEIEDFRGWIKRTKKPIIFVQVFFDLLYALSFERMLDAIAGGHLVKAGDVTKGTDRTTGKSTYQFALPEGHRVGTVEFPNHTDGVVEILENGAVVPYLKFAPAAGKIQNVDRVQAEIKYTSKSEGLR